MKNDNNHWNIKTQLLERIKDSGGWVNAHAHFDRAFTITEDNFKFGAIPFQEKWALNLEIQKNSSTEQIFGRMQRAVEVMLDQGVQAVGTFIDVNSLVKDRAIRAAIKLREEYGKDLELVFINQTLEGVMSKKAREWFCLGAEFVDIVGGLPSKDKWFEEEHMDIVLSTAKQMGKMAHLHVDQLNSVLEKETEMLARKTIEHGMQGRVVAIHGISLATHPFEYRRKIYRLLREAGVMVVANPTAYIDDARKEMTVPSHNSVTPVDELLPAGITVAIGTDNISDLHKPFTDGDMWTELRMLLEACRFFDLDSLVKIATENGRKVLGLPSVEKQKTRQLIFENKGAK